MKGWKIGGITSFSIVTLVYGIIIYILSTNGKVSSVLNVLKTYPIMLLIFIPVGIVLGLIISTIMFFFEPKPKRRRKKGQIWVSTVLYIALGIIAMTVILSAGIPMINRMKERNTVIESKEMMHAISDAITTVVTEGPGSRRVLDPVIIKGGKLIFDVDNEKVRWEMKTSSLLMESCKDNGESYCTNEDAVMREGDIKVYLLETIVVDEYLSNLLLDYSNVGVDLVYTTGNKVRAPLTGTYLVAISNDGKLNEKITVGIYVS